MFTLGAAQSFDALLYGEDHPSTISYLQSQFVGVNHALSDASRAIYEKAKSTFEYFTGHEAMRFARDAMKLAKGVFETPRIVTLWDMQELQSANLVMQRWVMASPEVRRRYHLQQCEGYIETYHDEQPGKVGDDHYDYRRVMDGMFQYDTAGDWKVNHYLDELKEGDRDLIFDEQLEIIRTWNAVDYLLALGGQDPTSTVGSNL